MEQQQMKRYIGTKIIFACPMTREDAEKHLGRNVGGTATGDGYLVEYEGGYQSWSPLDAFEEAYRRADGMSFGLAIEAAKRGLKIARKGWDEKNMWVVLMPGLKLPPFNTQAPGAKVNDRTAKFIGPDTPLDSQPYFAIWTAMKQWHPGWLPSQADMLLADDWYIVY